MSQQAGFNIRTLSKSACDDGFVKNLPRVVVQRLGRKIEKAMLQAAVRLRAASKVSYGRMIY